MTSGISGLNPQNLLQGTYGGAAQKTGTTTATQAPVGTGATNAAGAAPDPSRTTAMSGVMASLSAMMPKISSQDTDILLLQVTTKLKETTEATEKDKIRVDTADKKAKIEEKQRKMDEAQEKIKAAEDKMKNLSIWDKIKIGFQFLSAILTMVAGLAAILVGAAAAATGVGVAAIAGGAMMITAGVLMLYSAIDATVAATREDGLGIAGLVEKNKLMKEGKTEEEAIQGGAKKDQLARTVIGAVTAALAIAGAIAAFPAGGGAAIIALTSRVTGVVSAISTMATSAGDITTGVLKYKATQERSEGQLKQADGKRMEANIQMLDDMIDQAMMRLKGAGERFSAMLDSLTDAIKDRGDTMSRVGLRA